MYIVRDEMGVKFTKCYDDGQSCKHNIQRVNTFDGHQLNESHSKLK